jgi:hypothetical protein
MTTPDNPYQATLSDPIAPTPAVARRQLLPVAIGLLVTSILHILGWLYFCIYVYSIAARPDPGATSPNLMVVYCMYYGISVLYCLLLITGDFSMLRRGSYVWAVTVCILALIPFIGPCYFFAVPFGVWGLLILHRPDVRDSFARL